MMLQIHKIKRDFYMNTGKSILKQIQNNETHILDLFIREVVQNSIDAHDKSHSSVKMDFKYGKFNVKNLADSFEFIGDIFIDKYGVGMHEYLSVKDINCTGLIGEIDPKTASEKDDKTSENLYNLVYNVQNGKEDHGAGGSWGIGKTTYFRLGNGLVIYYTRVKYNGIYQSRLIGCLIEDESSSERLIKDEQYIGISLFGEIKNNTVFAITNEEEISKVISIFGIKPYLYHETGTAVIIPFVDKENILRTNDKMYWQRDIAKYIEVAIQKWYFPRLFNDNKHVIPLEVTINDIAITRKLFIPFFLRLQELYNATFIKDDRYKVEDISVVNEVFGKLVYCKFNESDLRMTPPDNEKSPLDYLGLSDNDDELNDPIIMFTRNPGMIINYHNSDSPWVPVGLKLKKEEFVFAIFRLDNKYEQYMRASEKADHFSWSDLSTHSDTQIRELCSKTPFSKITRKVKSLIKTEYSVKEVNYNPEPLNEMSQKLGKLFLPPDGYGTKPNVKRGNGKGGTTISRNKDHNLAYIKTTYGKNPCMHFDLSISSKVKDFSLVYKILSSGTNLSFDEWIELGFQLPIKIEKIVYSVNALGTKKISNPELILTNITEKCTEQKGQVMCIEPICDSLNNIEGLKIIPNNQKGMTLSLYIYVLIFDKTIQTNVVSSVNREV